MNTLLSFLIAAVVLGFFMLKYLRDMKKSNAKAREAEEKGKLRSDGPQAQHPHIDVANCIGCAACTSVCPEGDVLAMIGGKAAIVNGYKCIGHSLCAEVCPVGAITMVMANPSMRADMPLLTREYETNIENLFIAGELGGLALIKNAIAQGRECVDTIARRLGSPGPPSTQADVFDLVIVGAGPAGISASLRAIENKMRYITLDEGEIGGTVAKYPRQKLVMTSPVEFPMYGKFKKMELSKEELIAFWRKVLGRVDFNFQTGEKVEDIKKEEGIFTVVSSQGRYRARSVILALGRTGSPRKLGVIGEDLPKVMYRLIEADHYVNKNILVVGGGDSAIEAALGLAHQPGNRVTLSYRKENFTRIKERNAQRVAEVIRKGKIEAVFNSVPAKFRESSVMLNIQGQTREIPNDFVWIFAGGEPPSAFLKKIGVQFGSREMSTDARNEARAQQGTGRENGAPTLVSR
jgi:thioredoxin reductase (NADPH)